MAVTETSRFGLTRWSAGSDPFTRAQMDQTHARIEERGALLTDIDDILGETELSATAATIAFTGIPQTFRHLGIMINGRNTDANVRGALAAFNGDTSAANYSMATHVVKPDLTHTPGGGVAAYAGLIVAQLPGTAAPSGHTGIALTHILNYANATFRKGSLTKAGAQMGTTSADTYMYDLAGWWHSTAAITSISLALTTGSFAAGTVATLFGIGRQ